MTLDEFLRELSLTNRNWRLDGPLLTNRDDREPLQAVADIDGYWVLAANKIGLEISIAEAVNHAAYCSGWHDKGLRAKLLVACGL